jgi:hypothetical protein
MPGMAIFPFILVRKLQYKADEVLINHERIHLQQQLEMLIIGFYLWYVLHYLVNLVKYRNHDRAYLNIVFEKEAYAMEHNLDYLSLRSPWRWTKFI